MSFSAAPDRTSLGAEDYRTHVKPYVTKLLSAIGLDVVFRRAEGDWLYTRDEYGQEKPVLDMLGGFGAALFGHNHPDLVDRARAVLDEKRPFVAQASVRASAGLLARRLSDKVGEFTGQSYIVVFGNSGAEAIEAAIKHAELERTRATEAISELHRQLFRRFRRAERYRELCLSDQDLAAARETLSDSTVHDLASLEIALERFNTERFDRPSRVLALRGAFHGKTTGALKLTHNAEFREPWKGLGIEGRFIARGDESELAQELNSARFTWFEPVAADGGLHLHARTTTRICAVIAEPIQGEGGIHEVEPGFIRALRRAADEEGFPLIMDEIQSGMGRTGEFLASAASGVVADYFVLSKSLGGGLAKIGAVLVPTTRYHEDFGYLHTSTFCEDDYASEIALGALDLLERDDGALIRACRHKGEVLLRGLREVQARYPKVIREVRGRGLMIGVELHPQSASRSGLIRAASDQHLLGFLLSGYLLARESIRVAPTLSANNTVRLEPSAFISEEDLIRTCEAFARAAALIDDGDAHRFAGYIAGPVSDADEAAWSVPPGVVSLMEAPVETDVTPDADALRIGFISHMIAPLDVLHWDPSLAPMSESQCERLLAKVGEVLDPFVVAQRTIRSRTVGVVELEVIGLAMTASQLVAQVRGGRLARVKELIGNAVEIARSGGVRALGFGGFTSIVTENCTTLDEDEIALTSGNSLTAAAAIEAIFRAAAAAGIDVTRARLGVVGGLGNIGRVLAEISAEDVSSIVLVGRPGTQRRLDKLADHLVAGAWRAAQEGKADRGIARSLVRCLDGRETGLDTITPDALGSELRVRCANAGDDAPIRISTDMQALSECDLVITATNAPEPIIFPEHLGNRPMVLCDVSVPADVHPSVARACPNVQVVKGGVFRVPSPEQLVIPGMGLAPGQAYACLSESVLLGLADIREHFSYGALTAPRVKAIRAMAAEHGFEVAVKEAASAPFARECGSGRGAVVVMTPPDVSREVLQAGGAA